MRVHAGVLLLLVSTFEVIHAKNLTIPHQSFQNIPCPLSILIMVSRSLQSTCVIKNSCLFV